VIFDFNGTLSDDEPLLLRIYTEMYLERLGWTLTPRHYYARLAGRSDREILEVVVEELDDDSEALRAELLAERRARYHDLVMRKVPIAEATIDLVRLLGAHDVPLGIVTGAEAEDVEHVLRTAGLGSTFRSVVTAERVCNGKPDPEGFLLGARELGIEPAACLVFEDSLPGIRAASAAGMACIALAGTRPAAELATAADAVVEHLEPDVFSGAFAG
jgi:beta-phosphoglucomutase